MEKKIILMRKRGERKGREKDSSGGLGGRWVERKDRGEGKREGRKGDERGRERGEAEDERGGGREGWRGKRRKVDEEEGRRPEGW